MFLEVSATLWDMQITDAGRKRAAAAFREAVGTLSPEAIAATAGISDPATVRTFLEGATWPRSKTRQKLESFSGIKSLEAIARGEAELAPPGDPVEVAIERSALTRGNKHRLIGTYYDMLDEQGEVRGA